MFKNISSFIKLKPALAVGFLFSSSSLLFGTWVASIPGIKERLGFTDGSLGLSLLLSPLGAITGMLLSTRVFSKIPVGKWMVVGYALLCGIMVLQINSVNRTMFWVCLYFFGAISFLNGVSSNATVNLLEKKYNRLLMSTCHGMYSLGGAVSAAFAVLLYTFRRVYKLYWLPLVSSPPFFLTVNICWPTAISYIPDQALNCPHSPYWAYHLFVWLALWQKDV
jgi:predicted MFS family arabinose efflux permease